MPESPWFLRPMTSSCVCFRYCGFNWIPLSCLTGVGVGVGGLIRRRDGRTWLWSFFIGLPEAAAEVLRQGRARELPIPSQQGSKVSQSRWSPVGKRITVLIYNPCWVLRGWVRTGHVLLLWDFPRRATPLTETGFQCVKSLVTRPAVVVTRSNQRVFRAETISPYLVRPVL